MNDSLIAAALVTVHFSLTALYTSEWKNNSKLNSTSHRKRARLCKIKQFQYKSHRKVTRHGQKANLKTVQSSNYEYTK